MRDAHPFHNECRASAESAVDYSADIALKTEGGMTMKVKAKDMVAPIKKKGEESQQTMEKAGQRMKNTLTQKNEAEQKHFDKKKADLEKNWGFNTVQSHPSY